MQDIIKGRPGLIDELTGDCGSPAAVHHSTDAYGNAYHWFKLPQPRRLPQAAARLKEAGARLCMISAYNRHSSANSSRRSATTSSWRA